MPGSIPLPRPAANGGVDARSLIASLQQVLGRLNALEGALSTTTAKANQNTLVTSQSNSSITNLASRISALETGTSVAATEITLRADVAVNPNTLVYASSTGGCAPVDPANLETARGIIGITTATAVARANVAVLRFGNHSVAGAAFTAGEIVYWGIDGFTHVPDYVPAAIRVGVATSATSLFVLPDWPTLTTHGVYTDLELFLPVTYSLVKFAVELVDTLMGQPDGLVVKIGGELQTRTITTSSGSGVLITDGSGVDGDPHIELG